MFLAQPSFSNGLFRHSRCLILALLFLSVETATLCHAQTTDLPFKTLSRQNGLSDDVNAFLFKDSRGLMWIGSVKGLNRFDGTNVKTYVYDTTKPRSLRGNNIQSKFFEDKKGDIWFSTGEAINVYRRLTDDFDYYYLHDAKGNELKNGYYAFNLDTAGMLWLRLGDYKNGQLYCFSTLTKQIKRGTEEKYSEEIVGNFTGLRTVVEAEPNGKKTHFLSCFWGGQYGIEEYIYDDNRKLVGRKSYFSGKKNDAFSPQDTFYVSQIVFDSTAQSYWVATRRGLLLWDKKSNKYLIYNDLNNKKIYGFTDIILRDASLYVSSKEFGVLVFDKNKQKFTQQILPKYANTEGGLLKKVENLFLDSEENLWLSSFTNGLFYTNIKRPKFDILHFPTSSLDVLTDNIIEDSNHNKWIVRRGAGILVFDKNRNYLPHFFSTVFNDYIRRLYRDKQGNIWALTSGQSPALYLFNPRTRAFEKINFEEKQTSEGFELHDIYQISDGQLLIGSSKGVFELDKFASMPKLKKCLISDIDERDLDVMDIFEDSRKTIYFNQKGQNLLVCKREKGRIRKINEVPINAETVDFIEQDNQLWLASNKGLLAFDPTLTQLSPPKLHLVGVPVDGILRDSAGHFWLGTFEGIVNFDPKTGIAHRYSIADLMQGYNFGRSTLADTEGSFWFGGTNGINVFKPTEVKNFPFAPRPHITQIYVNNVVFSPDSSIIEKKYLILPYKQNTVRLELAAVEFSDAPTDSIAYTFNLDKTPADKQFWTTLSNASNPSVSLINLREGNYVLQLKATNSDGIWSEIRTLVIEILPPWYRTWWFYSLVLALVAATIYEAVRRVILFRENRLREQAAFEKKIMVTELKVLRLQMNPHFIFNTLNAIRLFVLQNNAKEASLFLVDFSYLMRKILNNSTKEAISLEIEEEILRGYLEMEQLRFDFEFDIKISDELDPFDTEVPPMILQPFVENAVLHGVARKKNGQGKIQVRFEKEGDSVLCTVQDNGIGMAEAARQRSKEHESKSQEITQDRLNILTQLTKKPTALIIENVETGGTKVTIKLPLN